MMNVEYSSCSGPSYTDLLPQASAIGWGGTAKCQYGIWPLGPLFLAPSLDVDTVPPSKSFKKK